MNYLLQSKKSNISGSKKVIVVFIVVAIFLFVVNFLSGGAVANVVRVSAVSLFNGNQALSNLTASVSTVFVQKQTLVEERDALKARVRELELYALNNMVLSSENRELRRLLGSTESALNQGVLARVLSRGGIFPYGTILVAPETTAVPSVGELVFGPFDVVLGTITEVSGGGTAVVTLLSASNHQTNVMVGAEERTAAATMVGMGHGNMIIKIARGAAVREGDPVVLANEKKSYLVGYVGNIEITPTDAFQTLRVRTLVNLETIQFVRIR